ncbi:WYL domain-containing protein [Erwinia persicina]|uniref:WYL domain-containing protein n=1 Tax=Erwinia persicina TaxID=55211 RepID=UPI00210757BD|nr:WYL domain-containing protein [Erwinia persicina]MCQ4106525.1 WYL domain-containing protein [Erwinia persicina]UTX14772.1 WYL domain-containing protein [Erwinia persicina]
MGIVFSLLSLTLSAWAIRSICIKTQSGGKKFGKSIFSLWYFLLSGGVGIKQPENAHISILMLAVGAAVVWYSNHIYTEPKGSNKDILNDYAAAVKDFDLPGKASKPKKSSTANYVKGRGAELTEIAFYYVNAGGESSFRDVDVKKFDGQYIEGYCHLSQAFKTFRLDRIDGDITLRDTGEAVEPDYWKGLIEK